MNRRASVAVLLLLVLALALSTTAQAATPTVETFVIDSSTGPYSQPAVDGDLVVWVDFRDSLHGGLSGIWGAVLGPGNKARAFEIAAAGETSLTGPRVAGSRVVWFSEDDAETGAPAQVWECLVDKTRATAGTAQVLAEGTEPDAYQDAVVWTRGPRTADSTSISVMHTVRKRTPRRIVRDMPGVDSAVPKYAARLSAGLLVWFEEPPDAPTRIMATRPWQAVTPHVQIVERSMAHAVDGTTVSYGLRNPAYGWFGYDVYVTRLDPATLTMRTLKLTSSRTDGWSDVSRDLVVWGAGTRIPGGRGDAIIGSFVDWSGTPSVAQEFVIENPGRYADQPAVTYDATTGRYLLVWTTQAIDDYNDNTVMGAWITPAAGGMLTAAAD